MSGLAEILLSEGYAVSGSDINYGDKIKALEKTGLEFHLGHAAENVANTAAVIYTAAVHEDNPEIIAAVENGIPLIKRSQLLGEIMAGYKLSAAVSGTHGKTTVTSMLSYIFEKGGYDPTILVGADLDIIGGNLKIGKSQIFLAEACEYHRSFLDFNPYCGIITGVEPDHLDYYRDGDDYRSAFAAFLEKITEFAVINGMDSHLVTLAKNSSCRCYTYGIGDGYDFSVKNLRDGGRAFDIYYKEEILCSPLLSVYGDHNIMNAVAAISLAFLMGLKPQESAEALSFFHGADRRLEFKGSFLGGKVYDDYAHHPTEIAATLNAVEKMDKNRTICVFQPHTYSRTKAFFEEFATAFSGVDTVIFADIFAAREANDGSINSKMLTDAARARGVNAIYIGSFDEIVEYLKDNTAENDIIIMMGAGDIVKATKLLLQ